MTPSLVESAARNNAIWCDTVCRAHGVPGEFFPAVWLNRNPVPRFYSNLVALSGPGDQSAVIEHVRGLMALPLPAVWSVKDSFADLDLAPLGFDVLFEALWIACEPRSRTSGSASPHLRWTTVTSAEELMHWEAAWSGDATNRDSEGQPRQFPPSLLADPQLAFFAGYRGPQVVAGGIANRTGDVVGLSNVFVTDADADGAAVWVDLVAKLQAVFPDLPLVGYERGGELGFAVAAGFEPIGPLRVWVRTPRN